VSREKPNIILIYADDLGRGMLSCYGQQYFNTPNLDRLACEGMRFTHAYGCAFCAPARASLLTGYHDCHAGRWSYTRAEVYMEIDRGESTYEEVRELINSTSFQERDDEVFLATIAKQAGYATGQVGKLEWGFSTTPERLLRHGWDNHFGYYDHARAHGFYPQFLFEDGAMVPLPGNTLPWSGATYGWETPENRARVREESGRTVYSQDLFDEKILAFLREHAQEPFFLYHPSQIPHGPIAIPEVHPAVKDVEGLTEWEKEYASMVLRLDTTVGLVLDELERLGLDENTLLIFTSDNGHEPYYREAGRCTGRGRDLNGRRYDNVDYKYYSERSGDVFNGNDGMAGNKLSSLEGGPRVPWLVRWPGHTPAGKESDALIANYDLLPTFAELLGLEPPHWKDGESLAGLLQGKGMERKKPYVVFAGREGPALVTAEGWKVRYVIAQRRFQLFHLAEDYREENDLAAAHRDRVRQLGALLLQECDGNFLHGTAENHKAVRIDEYMRGEGPQDSFPEHPHMQQRQG
jgi:arylsulfatase A-like enzyme